MSDLREMSDAVILNVNDGGKIVFLLICRSET